jgi:hypothetical protein
MELQDWQKLTDTQKSSYSEALAANLPQPIIFKGLQLYHYIDRELSIALFEYRGALFSLIPGGEVQLGYDARNFRPTNEQIESFQDTTEVYEIDRDIYSHVQSVTTPPRTVTISPMLVEMQPTKIGFELIAADSPEIQDLLKEHPGSRSVNCGDRYGFERGQDGSIEAWQLSSKTHEYIEAELAAEGLRLLTFDEWEYVCGAGSTTLFRWGDFCPDDCYPNDRSGWKLHLQPNLFGLHIAQNPYDCEITREKHQVRGGDGGCCICGGVGFFLGWLALATAYWEPDMLDWLDEEISGLLMRRVIPLPY